MSNRAFFVVMIFALVFAVVPKAFAGDSGPSAEQDVAAAAGTEKEAAADDEQGAFGNSDNTAYGEGKSEDEGNLDHGETADKPGMTVKWTVGYTVDDEERYYSVSVTAFVPCEESITGKFEMFLDGKEPVELDWEEVAGGGYTASAPFILKKAGTHKLLVRFKGEVDGEKVILESKETVKFPGNNFRLEVNHDAKGTFGGKLLGVKNAEGRWSIQVFDPRVEEGLLEEHESGTVTSLEYSHTFKGLKPGTYEVRISYNGIIDGVKATAKGFLTVRIGGDKGNAEDPGNEKPPAKEGPDDESENNKGGKLPATSTPYPGVALLGLLVLSAGLVLLKWRKAKEFRAGTCR